MHKIGCWVESGVCQDLLDCAHGGNYFEVKHPHILHNDVPHDTDILPGKCIVIPLEKVYAEFKVPNDTDAKF